MATSTLTRTILLLSVATGACFQETMSGSENEAETEAGATDDTGDADEGDGKSTGPSDDGGASTEGGTDAGDSATDTGTSSGKGSATKGDTGGTNTGDDTTDARSTDEEDWILDEGDLCHPIDPSAKECDSDEGLVCVYDGFDMDTDHYEWVCKKYTGNPSAGGLGDGCSQYLEHTDCQTGHQCVEQALFPDGLCDDTFCCTPECNPELGGIDCPNDVSICEWIHNDPNLYPPVIADSNVPFIGKCRAS